MEEADTNAQSKPWTHGTQVYRPSVNARVAVTIIAGFATVFALYVIGRVGWHNLPATVLVFAVALAFVVMAISANRARVIISEVSLEVRTNLFVDRRILREDIARWNFVRTPIPVARLEFRNLEKLDIPLGVDPRLRKDLAGWLAAAASAKPASREYQFGAAPRFYALLSIYLSFSFLIALSLGIMFDVAYRTPLVIAISALSLCAVFGAVFVSALLNLTIRLRDDSMELTTFSGARREYPASSIVGVRRSRRVLMFHLLVIDGGSKREQISIPSALVRDQYFEAWLSKRAPRDISGDSLP